MAAEVSSSLVRVMNGGDANESRKTTAPITRDLLGGGCRVVDSQELDLDLQVPCGWEKRLDLKSGRVYIQRCNSLTNSAAKFQDLNFPPTTAAKPSPSPSPPTLTLFDDGVSLDLKLLSPAASSSPPSCINYQSVCTLDKVKSALDRAEKETTTAVMKRPCSPPRSTSSSSTCHDEKFLPPCYGGAFAAGCPSCLLYVLIAKDDPRCPKCNRRVPLMGPAAKKPRIDLNISI